MVCLFQLKWHVARCGHLLCFYFVDKVELELLSVVVTGVARDLVGRFAEIIWILAMSSRYIDFASDLCRVVDRRGLFRDLFGSRRFSLIFILPYSARFLIFKCLIFKKADFDFNFANNLIGSYFYKFDPVRDRFVMNHPQHLKVAVSDHTFIESAYIAWVIAIDRNCWRKLVQISWSQDDLDLCNIISIDII